MLEHRPTAHRTGKVPARQDFWWRGAVIYQIYPRSFCDGDGDGVGDFKGILTKIDYLAALGVDVIWISPFYRSPMKDFGYDVQNYCEIDPIFGDMADFDAVLAAVHKRGLKLMMDFVPSHTSDQHAWFVESRSDRTNAKADWYVWADAKSDGTPPNNWISIFGGSAWAWEPRRRQYYLHNFLAEQPDMNFHCQAAVDALIAQARFWLERGVDGFRVDAIDFGVHDPDLPDNPVRNHSGRAPQTPYDMQYQRYNKALPELSDLFLKPLWRATDDFPSRALLGEISGDHALTRMAEYSMGGGLDMTYSFDLLTVEPKAAAIRAIIETLEAEIGDGWPCWAFSNHDVRRSATQFGGSNPDPRVGRFVPVLLGSLRGTICIYQGEELGLPEAEIANEDMVDPVGIRFYPDNPGRDGCRTPMPWQAGATHVGFSSAAPWLPVCEAHRLLAVDRQESDPASVLHATRQFLQWRKQQSCLIDGAIEFVDAPEPLLAFARQNDTQKLLCVFNLSANPARLTLDAGFQLTDCPANNASLENQSIDVAGWGVAILKSG